jgi:hypothetical protein
MKAVDESSTDDWMSVMFFLMLFLRRKECRTYTSLVIIPYSHDVGVYITKIITRDFIAQPVR